MPSKSIFIILSYTISKLVHFFLRHNVVLLVLRLAAISMYGIVIHSDHLRVHLDAAPSHCG